MSDDKTTPPEDEIRTDGTPEPAADETPVTADPEAPPTPEAEEPGPQPEPADSDTPEKPKLSDEEKAAKIAAAKAKAAAAKAAKEAADAEPKQPWEEKPVPPEHEESTSDPDVAALAATVDGSVVVADRFAGDVTVTVSREQIVETCRFLKEEQGYTFLVDLTAVDWPEREGDRFDVVYWMHRFDDSKRLRLLAPVPDGETIPSVAGVWKTANWLEREVYDMFGIVFDDHPGLERILMWEGFNGHPLRKDFPVEGIDTGAAIYPDVYPEGGGPVRDEELEKPPAKTRPRRTPA